MSLKILGCKKLLERLSHSKDDIVLSGVSIVDDDLSSDACFLLCCLYRQLSSLLESKATDRKTVKQSEAEDANYAPPFWVSKWAKSSQKSGFCYELCDRSVGILFDDQTQFIMDSSGQQALYYDQSSARRRFHLDNWPSDLQAKQSLLESFCKRRSEYKPPPTHVGTELELMPRLRLWRMTSSSLILQLTDGTVQVNYLNDHMKMVLSPSLNSLSLVDSKRNIRTYRLQLLEKHGCTKDLFHRAQFAKRMIELLIVDNDDCISTLSQDGYEIRRSASLPTSLSDFNGISREKFVFAWIQEHLKK